MKKTWQVQERLTKSVTPHSFNKDLRSGDPAFHRTAGLYHFLYGANAYCAFTLMICAIFTKTTLGTSIL